MRCRGPRSAQRRTTSTAIGLGAASFAPRTASVTAASQLRGDDPVASVIRTALGAALAALGRIALEPVLLDLGIEEPTIDPEHLRRLRAVPGRIAERLHDQVLLEL